MFLFRTTLFISGLMLLAATSLGVAKELDSGSRSVIFLPIALGIGSILSALAIGTRWQNAALWFSVAMVGQTLVFQLVNAGPQLRYQHYKPFGELLAFPHALYLGGILLQLIAVVAGMRKIFPGLAGWIRSNMRGWQLIVIALCLFLPTTTVSPDPSVYVAELILASFIQLLSLATLVLFAASLPADLVTKLDERIRTLPEILQKRSLTFAVTAALFVTLLGIVLNLVSYEQHPHVPDEVAYLVQAKLFASGAISVPAPPVPEAFDVYLMKVDGGLLYPVTPPGWALLLSIGAFIGAPLVINPILAGVNVLLTYWLVGRLYSPKIAMASALLLVVSPWFVFLGMSFMTHMSALTCFLVAAVGVVKARETGNWIWGLVAGVGIGFLSMIRPLEAVAVAGLIGLWVIGLGGKRLSLGSMGGLALGTLLLGSAGLAFNAKLTGNPLQFPINRYADEVFGAGSNDYGFGPDRGMGWQLDPYPGHGPIDALVNTNLNISALNTELLGWTIGSFLMIGAFVCFGRLRTSDYLMIALVAVIYVLHFFYYFSGGPDFGARYWFLMIVPLVVLTVRGIGSLAAKLGETNGEASGEAPGRLYASVGVLMILTVAFFIPWRAVDKYRDFRGMMPDVRELETEFAFGRSLVLVQGNKHPDFDSAFVYNSLDLSGNGPIYAWDRDDATRQKLLSVYPDRPVWMVKSPSLTGRGFEVAAGPLDANTLLTTRNQ